MTPDERDHALRKLYSERHHLTRAQRLGHLSESGATELHRITARIDVLELEESAGERRWHDEFMSKLEAIHREVEDIAARIRSREEP
jgi:DNA-binding transcriptional MerR regulator